MFAIWAISASFFRIQYAIDRARKLDLKVMHSIVFKIIKCWEKNKVII